MRAPAPIIDSPIVTSWVGPALELARNRRCSSHFFLASTIIDQVLPIRHSETTTNTRDGVWSVADETPTKGRSSTWPLWARIGWLLLALFAAYVCLFDRLTGIGLVGPDEPRYAAISRAMADGQDWVTPRLNDKPWLEKPILFYWAAASAYRLVGDSELAARLPSALSAAATGLMLAWLGWRLYGATTAAVVLLLFPTTVSAFAFARGATTDMLFTMLLALAMVTAARLVFEPIDRARGWQVAFGSALGLAVLAKGPAAVVLAAGSLALWGVMSRDVRRLTALARPLTWLSLVVVSLPWYVISAMRNPGFVEVFLIRHNIDRFLTPTFQHEQPFWFFGPILVLGLVPWSAFLLPGVRQAWHRWQAGTLATTPSLYVACWVVFPILFFSLSKSKLPGYILPAIPAAALLLARTVACFLDSSDRDARWPLFGTAVVLAGVAGAFAVPEIAISGVPGLPFDSVRPLAPVMGVASVTVAAAAYWRLRYISVATVALMFVIGIGYLNSMMVPHLDPLLSPRTVARRVQETATTEDLAVYRLHRAWNFGLDYYLNRDLPEWSPDTFVSPVLVVTNEKGIVDLQDRDLSVEILDSVSQEGVLVRLSRPPTSHGSIHGK